MTIVVTPPASAASPTCGESQWTWASTAPGVTTRPVASRTAVSGSRTTPMPSMRSGLPARPSAATRPPVTPIDVRRTPSTGSRTRPPTIARSTPPRPARTPRPSRIVPPQAGTSASGPPASSASGTTCRALSARRTGSGTAVPLRARALERCLARAGRVERSVDQAGVPADDARAREGHGLHRAWLPRREEDLHAGRHRQAAAPRGGAVEPQRGVDLEEVEVRGDPDRDRALVDDLERDGVGLPEPGHRGLLRPRRRARGAHGVLQHDEPRAVGEGGLDLDARQQVGDAVEHVVLGHDAVAPGDGLGVGEAVAGGLADLVGDERGRLGLRQREPAGAAAARELGGQEEQEPVLLAGQQAHGAELSQAGPAPRAVRSGRGRQPAKGRRSGLARPAVHLALVHRGATVRQCASGEKPWRAIGHTGAMATRVRPPGTTSARGRPVAALLAVVALAVLVWGGYGAGWSWTGFGDNDSLWDWLHLLLLPVAVAALPLWLTRRGALHPRRRRAAELVGAAFVLLVVLGYLVPMAWTGFPGNQLWD